MFPENLAAILPKLNKIQTNCKDTRIQNCLFIAIHNNEVIPILKYWNLYKLEEVQRLESLVQHKDIDLYIKVLTALTAKLTTVFTNT